MHYVTTLVAAALFATTNASFLHGVTGHGGTAANRSAGIKPFSPFSFSQINPSKELIWRPCFGDKRISCASLLVPLDYANTSAGYINTDWIRFVPHNNSAEDIIFNPGGPGVGGINYILHAAQHADSVLSDFIPQHNLVSFNPRGIQRSGPPLYCFPGASILPTQYRQSNLNLPMQYFYEERKAYGQQCTMFNSRTNAKYAGTVAVAQDIMHFVNLRHAQRQKGTDSRTVNAAKVLYYGVSYGTVIGQTLAALYPNRIGRMVLDGNVDSVSWYTGFSPHDVHSTDAAFHSFFQYCFEAGPNKCSFYGNAKSVDDIENRYITLLQDLGESPQAMSDFANPFVVDNHFVTSNAFHRMYTPMYSFPMLANILTSLEHRVFDKAHSKGLHMSILDLNSPDTGAYSMSIEAHMLISCIDVNKNYSIKSFEDYLEAKEVYKKESYYAGDNLALRNLPHCVGMDIAPPPSQTFHGFSDTGYKTSTPILFVNPMRDPITPLISAHKMSAYFPGSVVLAQNSTGHSVTTMESRCTAGYMRAYFKNGTLPLPGTICQPDVKPFINRPTKRALYTRTNPWILH